MMIRTCRPTLCSGPVRGGESATHHAGGVHAAVDRSGLSQKRDSPRECACWISAVASATSASWPRRSSGLLASARRCRPRSRRARRSRQKRARTNGLTHVTFEQATIDSMRATEPFDAAVGRFVLMYQADPVATLSLVSRHVKPGGIIVFQEPDFGAGVATWPAVAIWQQVNQWIVNTFRRGGVHHDIGGKLYHLFQRAGLPGPTLLEHITVGGGGVMRPCCENSARNRTPASCRGWNSTASRPHATSTSTAWPIASSATPRPPTLRSPMCRSSGRGQPPSRPRAITRHWLLNATCRSRIGRRQCTRKHTR